MKIFTFKILLLVFFCQTVHAQITDTIYIDNPGIVGGKWTSTHRYIARSDIFVPYDSVLNVLPGVKIEIENGFSFRVEGQLIANGSQNDSIGIKPYHDGWNGMTFGTPSGEQNMNTSELSFIKIDCGSYTGSISIQLSKHRINSINNLRIINSEAAIKITGFATIDDIISCSFKGISRAIAYQYCDVVSQILIENCSFEKIFEKAVYISHNAAFLETINVEGCEFDNSALDGNNSESALYIATNNQLTSVTVNSCTFKYFGMASGSPACIYIEDNDILGEVSLVQDDVLFCGGETGTSPAADFGGFYIDQSQSVYLEENHFSNNIGKKSGAGFIRTGQYAGLNNSFLNNSNNGDYTGGYFAGAVTLQVAQRVEMNEDQYNSNNSAKSGGAIIIESQNPSTPVDLFFDHVTLSGNTASNEGGAVFINATADTIEISNSEFANNSSSAGSGGCFSVFSSAFNELIVEFNTLQDNNVSEIAYGGFLYLAHDPLIVPSYETLRIEGNHNNAVSQTSGRNYSIFYSKVRSFPHSCSITGENISNNNFVNKYLYHLERLQSGPNPANGDLLLTVADNEFMNNQCPVLYVANDSCTVTADVSGNIAEAGSNSLYGTFITLECNKVISANFENEQYDNLISAFSGGAVSVTAVNEINDVRIEDVYSVDCYSGTGDGGHFSLISRKDDPAHDQEFILINSTFSNLNNSIITGGNGGAIYYSTPGKLDSILLRSCHFTGLQTNKSGGAFFVKAKEVNDLAILGSGFASDISSDSAGAVYVYAANGNVRKLFITPYGQEATSFSTCHSADDGGALCIRASKEIGPVVLDSLMSDNCYSTGGNGGHLSFISGGNDPAVVQTLDIRNSSFGNPDSKNATGGDGGAVYYKTPGNLDSLHIRSSLFSGLVCNKSGGAVFVDTKEIGKVRILGSAFTANSSSESAGAVYINAAGGDIKKLVLTPYSGTPTTFTSCSSTLDGGALFVKASGEIGPVVMDSVEFENCSSAEGNGGHVSLVSGGSNPSLSQDLVITASTFNNPDNSLMTGGKGGAIYYKSPGGDLDSILIRSCLFSGLKAIKTGGAFCIDTKGITNLNILGSQFNFNSSADSAGAVYAGAGNGNVKSLLIAPYGDISTSFTSCHSKNDGGALVVRASKEIGSAVMDSVLSNNCYSSDGDGGHISLISLGSDPALEQELRISGSYFSNAGINSVTGGNGGVLSYNAFSGVSSVLVINSTFNKIRSVKNGGSIYLASDKIDSLGITSSHFTSSSSEVMSGGAVYLMSEKGLIDGAFSSNKFTNCTSNLNGGSVYIQDNENENVTENLIWSDNSFRKENLQNMPDAGGAIYCKGINSVSVAGDSAINQASSGQGGYMYLENVYHSVLDGIYAFSDSSASGGVIYNQGDAQSAHDQSSRVFNSTFFFNKAQLAGGCFYMANIDSVEFGKPDNKNVFVANKSLSSDNSDQVGGGVFYIQNAERVDMDNNSFYVNKSGNSGGVGMFSNVSSSLLIENNNFLNNNANSGGVFTFINTITNSVIADNNFTGNSSAEQGGALLFSPSSGDNFTLRDNTFFKNATGKLGGAIASYRPVSLIRNLFQGNNLTGEIPNEDHNGSTVYLNGSGDLSRINNCVFDQNYSAIENAASIYFGASPSLPDISIANCSFFNRDQYQAVFNSNNIGTVNIINSIFTIRENELRDDAVTYFNETVKSTYCDLIYSDIYDTINNNYDEYIYFNSGDYFFDSLQYPVDKGNPDPVFYDFHFPPAYKTLRNDLGISGGPDNPDSSGTFLFHEPVDLPTKFAIIVTSSICFDFTFECRGDFVANYDYFYWFLPDTTIRTDTPVLHYSFSPDSHGNITITALGHDISNAEVYGYGDCSVNLDIILIKSLATEFENNNIPVSSLPFTFNINAEIYEANNSSPVSDWNVIDSYGLEYTLNKFQTSAAISLQKITELPPFLKVEYTLSACGSRVIKDTIEIQILTTDQWGYPQISFLPANDTLIENVASIEIIFSKKMTKINGDTLGNADVFNYLSIDYPCNTIAFHAEVANGANQTTFILLPYNTNTQLPDILCNGLYKITVNGGDLFTENYHLPGPDTIKFYNNIVGINDDANVLDINIYPNPFQDDIHIDFEKPDNYYVEITDLRGRVQKTGHYAGVNEITINLEPLPDGMYLLHMADSRMTRQWIMKINKITH